MESQAFVYLPYKSSAVMFFFVVVQEVQRIKREHPDDDKCIVNDRVKGRLKVTRAFGAGYLKQVMEQNWLIVMIVPMVIINQKFVYVCTGKVE
jgi:hypothetical protein